MTKKEIIERLETIKAYAEMNIQRFEEQGMTEHCIAYMKDTINDMNAEINAYVDENESLSKLWDVYNDYLDTEFMGTSNVKKSYVKMGLMYTTDEDTGDDLEMYYDTQDKVFYGLRNHEIVFEKNADYDLATKIIECNGFDDYYHAMKGDELCY